MADKQPPAPPQRTESVPLPQSQRPMERFEPPAPTQDPASKAQSAKLVETCPDCGSNNYFGVQGSKPRCYECGYPMEQSGSKYGQLQGAHVEGDTQAARGNNQVNNYDPTKIVGRIE